MLSSQALKVLYITTEMVPFARTGGLAQVAAALPRAVRELGADVRIMLPRYGLIDPQEHRLRRVIDSFSVPFERNSESAGLWQSEDDSQPVYLIENDRFFGSRRGIYSFPDDAERFVFFSRACLEAARHLGWQPQVLHCNEWQTALIPNWIRTIYADDPFFKNAAVIYNIHNLAYQGIFGHRVLEIAGIEKYGFIAHPEVSPDLNEVVSLMARGVIFADAIVTVSPTYAVEILTPEFGQGLDPLLRDRQNRLYGILNGIDTTRYDPQNDPALAQGFCGDCLAERNHCKQALQREVGLPERSDVPIISLTSRLNAQKGYDIFTAVLEPMLLHLDAQWVIMGTGEQRYHDFLMDLQARYPQQLRTFLTYNENLMRRMFAGCDIFLMPSRHEPCGLDQLLAMHYGAIPVVRSTGGLADTVTDHHPPQLGSGFTFKAYDGMALFAAIVRALEIYRHPELWRDLQRSVMAQDLSWRQPATAYYDLYHRAISLKMTGRPA